MFHGRIILVMTPKRCLQSIRSDQNSNPSCHRGAVHRCAKSCTPTGEATE